MKPSSRSARLAAYFVDLFIIGVVRSVVARMVPPLADFATLTGIVYFCLMTYYEGATLGKKFFGIKVIAENGKLTWKNVILREVLGKIVSVIVLGFGYIWILFDKRRQGWHDKIGSTLVVEVTPLAGLKKALAYFCAFCMLILPVIGIIGVLAASVLVAINPQGQLQKAKLQQQMLQQQYQQPVATPIY